MTNQIKLELAHNLLEYFWIKGWLTDEEFEKIEKRNRISFSI